MVKEQKFRPKIDDHDYETKKSNVIRFLEKGSKVKVTIMFRGREQSRPELGTRLLDRLAEDVADYGIVDEVLGAYAYRNKGNYFAGKRGGKKYGEGTTGPLDLDKNSDDPYYTFLS